MKIDCEKNGDGSGEKSPKDEEFALTFGIVFYQMLDRCTWEIVREAMENGGTCRFEDSDGEVAPYLRQTLTKLVIKEDASQDDTYVLSVPPLWVRLFKKYADLWEKQREQIDMLESYACAAVHLYGAVTIKELGEITIHYDPGAADYLDEMEKYVIVRAKCPRMPFRLEGDMLLHSEFFCVENPDAYDQLASLREAQKSYPRWYPETREDLFKWEFLDYFERSAETGWLASEVKAVCKISDRDSLEEIVALSYSFLQCGMEPESVIKTLTLTGNLPQVSSKPRQRLLDALNSLAEVVHVQRLNGNSIKTLGVDKPLSPPEPEAPKISRNAPCPCGSGKKYKLCCGRKV